MVSIWLNRRELRKAACASALLANIYLHYVLDLWFEAVARKGGFRGEANLTT